jgi:hypothetical protein
MIRARQKVGDPTWEPVGFVQFTGPMGTPADPTAWHRDLGTLLAPNHIYSLAADVLAPGVAHAGPYDGEWAAALAAQGRVSTGTLSANDWSTPRGLTLAMMLVHSAGAPLGASPDFGQGPVLPDALQPLHITAALSREGVAVDTGFDRTYPAMHTVAPAITPNGYDPGDGYDHVPLVFGESTARIPGTAGAYEWRVVIEDATGAGWNVVIPFTVE